MIIDYDNSNSDGSYVEIDSITAILATKFSTSNSSKTRYASFSLLIIGKSIKSNSRIRLYKGKYYSITKSFKLADNVRDQDFNLWALYNINKIIMNNYNFIGSMIVIQFPNIWDLKRLMVSDGHYKIKLTTPDGSVENINSLYKPKYRTIMKLKHINADIVDTTPKIIDNNNTNRSISLAICMAKALSSINRKIRNDNKSITEII